MNSIIAPIISAVVGGALAVATFTGVVMSQTSAPQQSPGSIQSPQFDYGTTSE